jgi:hypothetical protein
MPLLSSLVLAFLPLERQQKRQLNLLVVMKVSQAEMYSLFFYFFINSCMNLKGEGG